MSERSARPRLDHYKGRSILKERENAKGAARSARRLRKPSRNQPRREVTLSRSSPCGRRDSSGRGPPARDTEMLKRGCMMELSLPSPVGKNLRTRGVGAVPACSGVRPSELTQRMSRTQSKHLLRKKVNTYLRGRRRKMKKARDDVRVRISSSATATFLSHID